MDGLQLVYDFDSVNNLDIGKFEIVLPHVVFCWFNTLMLFRKLTSCDMTVN